MVILGDTAGKCEAWAFKAARCGRADQHLCEDEKGNTVLKLADPKDANIKDCMHPCSTSERNGGRDCTGRQIDLRQTIFQQCNERSQK